MVSASHVLRSGCLDYLEMPVTRTQVRAVL